MTLVLYTWATPNGHKPQILLEELGVPYELKPVNILTGEQFTEDFRRINPAEHQGGARSHVRQDAI